jgi:alginate O-acetyltransferase complex protein AlgI
MLFNSIEFIIFLLLVYVLYWFVLQKNLTIQNFFLLIASYVFYGWWDWRFLLLLILSTIIDYSFGLLIYRSTVQRTKKLLLWLSIFNNLAILGFFKYYNFFADSTKVLFSQLGMELHPYMLSIALPVGISFYTFHGMSYVFDIYNGKAKPSTNPVNYSVFVCFFPLLVAGPIERGTHLLPQGRSKKGVQLPAVGRWFTADAVGLFQKDSYCRFAGATGRYDI